MSKQDDDKQRRWAKRDNLKIYHRAAGLMTVIIFGLMIWDVLANESRWFTFLLILMAIHLVIQAGFILVTFFGRFDAPSDDDGRRPYTIINVGASGLFPEGSMQFYTKDGHFVEVVSLDAPKVKRTNKTVLRYSWCIGWS